jgi:mono/diheme cytochrome c family protein
MKKFLLVFIFVLSSCGKPSAKTQNKKTIVADDNVISATKTAVTWKESTLLPESFRLPVQRASLISDERFLVLDAQNQAFIFDIKSEAIQPSNIPTDVGRLVSGQTYEQSSETQLWSLTGAELTRIRWGATIKDLEVSKLPLSSVVGNNPTDGFKIQSTQLSSVLLRGPSLLLHVNLEKSEKQIREFGITPQDNIRATDFGHLFFLDAGKKSLSRLLEKSAPAWHRHELVAQNQPANPTFLTYDLSGSSDAVRAVGFAAVGQKIWVSSAAVLGSASEPASSTDDSTDDSQSKLTAEKRELFIKYCAVCHEGRAPVFVQSAGGQKSVVAETLMADKEKILRVLSLPANDLKAMPPYGRPRPSPEEMRLMTDL